MTARIAFGLAFLLVALVVFSCELQSQEASRIVVKIRWCEWQPSYASPHPQACRVEEITPADHATVSVMECMRGLAFGAASFWEPLSARWWEMRGGTCVEVPDAYLAWKNGK